MDLRLTAPSLDFWVDIRPRSFGGRWIAVADIAGDKAVGTGTSARAAMREALAPLGGRASAALIANVPSDIAAETRPGLDG